MKQVYPWLKRSQPLPFPLDDCSFPRSGLSDLATLISEKKSPLWEKEVGPWPFPLGDILVFRPYRTFIKPRPYALFPTQDEQCSRDALFSTEVTWNKSNNSRNILFKELVPEHLFQLNVFWIFSPNLRILKKDYDFRKEWQTLVSE